MTLSQAHEFHFVITRNMKKSLKNINIFREFRSFSGSIVQVLSLITPIIKREHIWGRKRMSRYLPVSDDPDEIREHVHVYLPEDLYKELKLLHQDLNVYSIAQLLRGFLEFFLFLVEKFGDNTLQELARMYKLWEEEKNDTRLTLRQYLRQLRIIVQHIPAGNRLVNVYDNNFSPFWIFQKFT